MTTPIGHITIIKKNGKDGPIFLLEPTKRPTYTIGSADTNHIRMALPEVLPLHASISIDEDERVHLCSGGGGETWCNGEVVSGRRLLTDSDVFRIAGRLFRVELGGEKEKENKKPSVLSTVSTPTKALSSRENVPLAIISASPSSTTTATPTRKPRVSAERDTGNTGSTAGGAQHSSHTSTPTPNRKSAASRTSTSPAANSTQRKSRGGGKPSMSPAPASDRKSNGGAAGRRESGPSTPASKKKARPSAPASPANATPSVAASTPAPTLPSPQPAADDSEAGLADKPMDEVEEQTAAAPLIEVEAEAAAAAETAVESHTSPQSIRDISSADAASTALYDDLPPFELPYTNGPLTTLMEDPEEEEDPPRPHTRRFLPTPVRKEVETMAASLASKPKDQRPPSSAVTVCAVEVEAEVEEERPPARVSVGDGDVCHVDDEIMLSPGTLHRRALQLRHIRYGQVIRELKRKLGGEEDTEESPEQAAETVRIVENVTQTVMEMEESQPAGEAAERQEEDMELEELLPSAPTTVSVTITEEVVTTVITPTRSSPRRSVATQPVPPSLPSPLKRDIRTGRQLRSTRAEQHEQQNDDGAADEDVDSVFLPVAELLAHETKPASRHSLPAGAKGKGGKKMAKRRATAGLELPSVAIEIVAQAEEPVASIVDVMAYGEEPTESAAVDEAEPVSTVADHIFDAAAPTSRKSLPIRKAGKRQTSRRATAAPAAPYTDEPDPASPPASLTTPHSAVPSTPSTPSKPAAASHAHTLQSTTKPLPMLPTPLRRSIRERGAREQREVVPPIKMSTPLRKEIREGTVLKGRAHQETEEAEVVSDAETLDVKEDAELGDRSIDMPEFVDTAVSVRHSLPSVVGGEKRTRGQKGGRRGTAVAKLAQQNNEAALETANELEQQSTSEPIEHAEAREQAGALAVHFFPSSGRPSSRRSLPTVQTGVRYTRRGGRQTTHAAFSSLADESASPSSPPADATIAMDGVPPTPASPHKSAAKRQSLRSHMPPTEEENDEEISTEAVFVPVERQVASRQSMPVGKREKATQRRSRQSAAPRVQQQQLSSNDMEVEEAAEMGKEQQAEVEEAAGESIDFYTAAPPARHSLPANINPSASSAHTRQSAGPTFQYEDAPVTSPPVLPSPVRRSIEQRLPRRPVTVQKPLSSPLARDLRRGKALRPVNMQADTAEQLVSADGGQAVESTSETAGSAMVVEEKKVVMEDAETAVAPTAVQPIEQPKRGRRKRQVEIATPREEEQPTSAEQTTKPTRSKRKKPAAAAEQTSEVVAVPAAVSAPVSILSTAVSRTRKGKRVVQIVEEKPAEEEQVPADERTEAEEAKAITTTAIKSGRKGRQTRTLPPPQSELVSADNEEEQPARRTKRGRRVEDEDTRADVAEQPTPTQVEPAAVSITERPTSTRSRRDRKEDAVMAEAEGTRSTRLPRRGAAEPEQADGLNEEQATEVVEPPAAQPETQPTRRRAGRSRATTADEQPSERSEAAATRKSRRKNDTANQDLSTAAFDDEPATADSSSSSRRSRTRKATSQHTAIPVAAPQQPNAHDEPASVPIRQLRGRRGAAAEAAQHADGGEEQAESEAVPAVSTSRTRKGRRAQQATEAMVERESEERKEEERTEEVADKPTRRGRRVAAAVAEPEAIDNKQPTATRASRRRPAEEQSQPLEAAVSKPTKRIRRTDIPVEQASSELNESKSGRMTRSRAGRG